ncbi:rab-GTPase-TBC domain-containing protein [Apodospora peruviana]|uniref:Rab-GTPase-TBC domain-containing protein n=1 Tax=Apodospora peruviana TaxID=516989 RepID=A0AAE0ICK3_9PEZI|nr:rab-GTPase-TBC domain-containing protein [Apodospora peruviana]
MMWSLAEAKSRWEETVRKSDNISELRRAVKSNGPKSPCQSGCRSVCWKVFLLFRDTPTAHWSEILRESRNTYSSVCAQHLKFIKHPEQLTALSVDPLADDPDSPWDVVRRDELIRAEILQDVRRLPEEPFYHEEVIQTMVLDILFLYCKLNPAVGGYRQGMHEILAPIVYVVAQDAIDRSAIATDDPADPTMVDMLDSYFIEHDSYALFSKVMGCASTFYEVGTDAGSLAPERNTIVEKSKHIHEVALMKIDQELANHLNNIEVLPQIFLIRWIRLLFGREFPFEQLLVFWDAIFAFDPDLELIDLICVAMLLRIRWTLLDADYSVALQLLLKYPAPQPPHGPHTFVDDAIYLRDHSNAAGGGNLILKYTGKSPAASVAASSSRPSTPSFQGFGSLRQRTLGAKSPLASSARLLQQQGVEALLQGAAKGMIERGEKLGLNQAVRDAVGEIRRNVQGFQEVRSSPRGARDFRPSFDQSSLTVTLMERRNRQLVAMLDESVTTLRLLVASKLEGDKEKHIEAVELAAAKIQFVKASLEDSSFTLPPDDDDDLPPIRALSISTHEMRSPTVALDTTPVVMTSSVVDETRSALSSRGPSPVSQPNPPGLPALVEENPLAEQAAHDADDADKMDTDLPEQNPPIQSTQETNEPLAIPSSSTPISAPAIAIATAKPEPPPSPKDTPKEQRPKGPIPTRSTLAQSSFSWMLEPDTTLSSSSPHVLSSFSSSGRPSSSSGDGGSATAAQKRRSNNASRERNAFLFGEVISEVPGQGPGGGEKKVSADEIFGLQPIRKSR